MSSVDAEGCNEVFVELEPDPVAGFHVGLVDPVKFPALALRNADSYRAT